MDSSEIQRFQRILEIQRNETMRSLDRLGDETRSVDSAYPQDVGDRCITSLSKESRFQQRGERRLMVRRIEAALARIQQDTFGVCVACGEDINLPRLDALPWTQYCLRCQQGFEQGKALEYRPGLADRQVTLRKAG
jgi:RNA polymerase-binding transcription factor